MAPSSEDVDALKKRVAELEELVQSLELQQSASAQIDNEARIKANEMSAAKIEEITTLTKTRWWAALVTVIVLALTIFSLWLAVFFDNGVFTEKLTDPWVKLAYITGHLALIGLMVSILLRALYTPTAPKDETLSQLTDVLKTAVNVTKGTG